MSDSVGISVVIPAYREAPNLDKLIPELKDALIGYEYDINIIDTVMPLDDTREVCDRHSVKYIARVGGNLYGDAIRTGISVARKDYILIMDGDGSHSPSDIKSMLKEVGNYDLIIGSRYVKGGQTRNPKILIIMSLMVNVCFKILLGLNVRDVSNSLRIYSSGQLKKLCLECSNFDIVEEILIKLAKYNDNLSIREVPITFNKRMYGESKRDLVKFACSYVKTLWRLFRIKSSS